jgi:hypothetical protein
MKQERFLSGGKKRTRSQQLIRRGAVVNKIIEGLYLGVGLICAYAIIAFSVFLLKTLFTWQVLTVLRGLSGG